MDKTNTYYETYIIENDTSLFTLAKEKNINPNLLAVLNGLDVTDYVYKEQIVLIPKRNYSYYITKEGDTLELVAKMFNISFNNLLKDNETIYLKEGQLMVSKK
ncbi:MAG: LysM peptidoglycan-binding domain-containing protein [Mollicutes bacterium]|nr:LysM peptidoglycan-binding domain-containing protein [Mollicutes bacterium]